MSEDLNLSYKSGPACVYESDTSAERVDETPKCKDDPRAPHGFDRNASHNEDRYVCECEGWEPPKEKTMKVKIDIDVDQVDKIVCHQLEFLLKSLEDDLERRKEGTGLMIFDADLDSDVQIIKKHIKAFKTVLKYYG